MPPFCEKCRSYVEYSPCGTKGSCRCPGEPLAGLLVPQTASTGIPDGWSRVDGVTGYLHGGEITSVYTNGRSVVILGDPDEDGGHDCDQMECGQSHVLVRLFDERSTLETPTP